MQANLLNKYTKRLRLHSLRQILLDEFNFGPQQPDISALD